MATVTLKISKGAYEAKILKLQNFLGRLDSTLTNYETLKNNMDKFIDGSDDNYESIRENVESNIKMVRKAKEMTEASIKMLQETLQDQENFTIEAKKAIDESIEIAKNTFKAAVEVAKLVD